jgi:hypothetical protein
MKSIIRVVSVVLGIFFLTSAFGADKRDQQLAEIAAVKNELKPLRERAYLEKDVIAARKTLDDAYRAYWQSVRTAMVRLEPAKQPLIEKEIKLRAEAAPVSAGSRAENYEKKAAAIKAAPTSPADSR